MERYSTSRYAADVAGITPEDIGVSEKNFVRKKELISTKKFKKELLESYGDNDFVLEKDVEKGLVQISISLNSDVTARGTVQVDDEQAGSTSSKEVEIGSMVAVKCNLSKGGDVFDGWYKGEEKVSSGSTYSFTAENELNLVAKIFFIDVSPSSLDFSESGGTKEIQITSNVNWTVS